MKTLIAACLMTVGLAVASQPAFACASQDDPPPSADIQRNPGTQEDCAVRSNPGLARIKLDQVLQVEASRDHEIGLRGSRRYRLVIACEDACTGMGVKVTDAVTGATLGEASGEGQPAVEFDLGESTRIKAIARMDACPFDAGCKYGVGVYTIGSGSKG